MQGHRRAGPAAERNPPCEKGRHRAGLPPYGPCRPATVRARRRAGPRLPRALHRAEPAVQGHRRAEPIAERKSAMRGRRRARLPPNSPRDRAGPPLAGPLPCGARLQGHLRAEPIAERGPPCGGRHRAGLPSCGPVTVHACGRAGSSPGGARDRPEPSTVRSPPCRATTERGCGPAGPPPSGAAAYSPRSGPGPPPCGARRAAPPLSRAAAYSPRNRAQPPRAEPAPQGHRRAEPPPSGASMPAPACRGVSTPPRARPSGRRCPVCSSRTWPGWCGWPFPGSGR